MLLELVLGSLLISSDSSQIGGCFGSVCGGRPAVYFQLLAAPLVQSELNLAAEQQTAITTLRDEYARRFFAARQQAAAAEGDIQRMAQARGKLQLELFDLDQSARKALESILSDGQEDRLTQIFRQLLGPELFTHQNYLAPLQLSATQSAAAGATLAEYRYKMERAAEARRQDETSADMDRRRLSQETFQRRLREFETSALAITLADLSDAQRAELDQLFGRRLDRYELRRQMQAASQARSARRP